MWHLYTRVREISGGRRQCWFGRDVGDRYLCARRPSLHPPSRYPLCSDPGRYLGIELDTNSIHPYCTYLILYVSKYGKYFRTNCMYRYLNSVLCSVGYTLHILIKLLPTVCFVIYMEEHLCIYIKIYILFLFMYGFDIMTLLCQMESIRRIQEHSQ